MSNSSGFLRDASRRQERARDPRGRLAERREKGLWSFLTWSFFLSQVATMQQASAAQAQAGGTGDEAGPTSDPAAGQAAKNALLPVEAAMLAGMQEAAPQATTQGSAQQATAPTEFLAGAPGEAVGVTAQDQTEEFFRRAADQCHAQCRDGPKIAVGDGPRPGRRCSRCECRSVAIDGRPLGRGPFTRHGPRRCRAPDRYGSRQCR